MLLLYIQYNILKDSSFIVPIWLSIILTHKIPLASRYENIYIIGGKHFSSSSLYCEHYDFIFYPFWITLCATAAVCCVAVNGILHIYTLLFPSLIMTNEAKNRTQVGHELQPKWCGNVLWVWCYRDGTR